MAGDYNPIQTNADRSAENWEKAKEAVRNIAKDMAKGLGQATDRLVVQGRDELANALFNGSAYWPGEHPEVPEPIEQQKTYDEVLREAAQRGGNDQERGRSR